MARPLHSQPLWRQRADPRLRARPCGDDQAIAYHRHRRQSRQQPGLDLPFGDRHPGRWWPAPCRGGAACSMLAPTPTSPTRMAYRRSPCAGERAGRGCRADREGRRQALSPFQDVPCLRARSKSRRSLRSCCCRGRTRSSQRTEDGVVRRRAGKRQGSSDRSMSAVIPQCPKKGASGSDCRGALRGLSEEAPADEAPEIADRRSGNHRMIHSSCTQATESCRGQFHRHRPAFSFSPID